MAKVVMNTLCVDDVDLERLTGVLRARVGASLEASYLRGKTILRDAVEDELGCSDEIAERLVETLELQGFVRFPVLDDETHPRDRQIWQVGRASWV
jgi:hypothetical protein